MPVGKQEFRTALGHFASSVTVVTTALKEGGLAGITVTAFTSLSLEPPLVLICIQHRAFLHEKLAESGVFAVNMLSEDQETLSRRFAVRDPDQFRGIGYTLGTSGAPLLADSMAALECRIVDQFAGGDHTIYIGQVEATHVREAKPLLYFRGGYAALA